MKCKECLAFINPDTGKIKHRFELEFNEKDLILEGRRPQLIKKLLEESLKEDWINIENLLIHLKKVHLLKFMNYLNIVFDYNPIDPENTMQERLKNRKK